MRLWCVVFVLIDTLFFAFPAYAYAPNRSIELSMQVVVEEHIKVGDFINRQMVACFKSEDLAYVISPKTTATPRAYALFRYPYRCAVQTITTYLLRPIRKLTTQGGVMYWILGVGSEPKGEIQFYVALPEDDLQ